MRKSLITIVICFLLFQFGLAFAQNDTIYLDEILIVAKGGNNIIKTNINAASLEMKNKHDAYLQHIGCGKATLMQYCNI